MPSKPLIIFLSGMEDLVYQSFAFQPFWFLRKTHLEELPQVTEKCCSFSTAVRFTTRLR